MEQGHTIEFNQLALCVANDDRLTNEIVVLKKISLILSNNVLTRFERVVDLE